MENESNVGAQIRSFLRGLFGSRLTDHMEVELMRLRNDYEGRLQDRERTISDLREQVTALSGKIDRYELVLLPLSSPMGDFFRPKPKRDVSLQGITDEPVATTWEEIQAQYYAHEAAEADKEKANGTGQLG